MKRGELECLVWKHTHRDYKGVGADGVRRVLHMITNQGTCSVPLSSLTEEELRAKLPRSIREALP